MKRGTRVLLPVMMLLQYAVWGFWLPVLGRYLQASPAEGGLGFSPGEVGWILGLASSIGAICAPFIGQIADRYFSSERCLAVLLFIGGIVKFYTAYQTDFWVWIALSILYSVLYVPTIALTNSLAFAHLSHPEREFPVVRVWGTIGWILAGWIFPIAWLLKDVQLHHLPPFYRGEEVADVTRRLVDALKFSGALSVLYAGYALLLPHTPPKADAVEKLAVGKAFRLLSRSSFFWLVIASLPISIIHNIYFVQTGPFLSEDGKVADSLLGPVMTVGQFAEIGVMAILGWMLARLGFKRVIAIGALGYFARFAIFSYLGLTTLQPDRVLLKNNELREGTLAGQVDYLRLTDGSTVEGRILRSGGDEIEVNEGGKKRIVPRGQIAEVQEGYKTLLKTPESTLTLLKPDIQSIARQSKPMWMILLSIAFHGFCFSCFFAAAFIYVDKIADIDIRHSAQAVFGIIILGIGPVLSAPAIRVLAALAGVPVLDASGAALMDAAGHPVQSINYALFWAIPSITGLATAILIMLFFRDETVPGPRLTMSEDAAIEASEVA